MGLKDQVLALEWIKNNIEFFGGNSDSITITGLSTGAASVHFHYLSPRSRNLFHKGMSISGSSLHSWALIENASQRAKKLGETLRCPTKTSRELLNCLKTVSAYDIVRATGVSMYSFPPLDLNPFGPVIEKNSCNAFLSEHPYKLIRQGRVLDVPWFGTYASHDGYVYSLRKYIFHC